VSWLTLLLSAAGPVATQLAKKLAAKDMPAWSKFATHAGVQVLGSVIATKAGVNPFADTGLDVGAAQQLIDAGTLAGANTYLGHVAYGGWRQRVRKPRSMGRVKR